MSPFLRDQPIDVLGLPVSVCNRLKQVGMRTVGQLLAATDQELLAISQFQVGHIVEVKTRLASYVNKHPELASQTSVAEEAVPSQPPVQATSVTSLPLPVPLSLEILSLSARSTEALQRVGCQTVNDVATLIEAGLLRNPGDFDQESLAEIKHQLDAFSARYPSLVQRTPLSALDLSVRSYNALARSGVYTVEALARLSDKDLRGIRNVGIKSFAEIQQKLEAYLAADPGVVRGVPPPKEVAPLPPAPPPPPLIDPDVLASARKKNIPLDRISVDRLALSEWDQGTVHQAGIQTVGELAEQPRARWERKKAISQRVAHYLMWLIKQEEAVWHDEVVGRGISPVYRLALA